MTFSFQDISFQQICKILRFDNSFYLCLVANMCLEIGVILRFITEMNDILIQIRIICKVGNHFHHHCQEGKERFHFSFPLFLCRYSFPGEINLCEIPSHFHPLPPPPPIYYRSTYVNNHSQMCSRQNPEQ